MAFINDDSGIFTDALLSVRYRCAEEVIRNHNPDDKQQATRLETASGNHLNQELCKRGECHYAHDNIERQSLEDIPELTQVNSPTHHHRELLQICRIA